MPNLQFEILKCSRQVDDIRVAFPSRPVRWSRCVSLPSFVCGAATRSEFDLNKSISSAIRPNLLPNEETIPMQKNFFLLRQILPLAVWSLIWSTSSQQTAFYDCTRLHDRLVRLLVDSLATCHWWNDTIQPTEPSKVSLRSFNIFLF